MAVEVTIRCSRCDCYGDSGKNGLNKIALLRHSLKKLGWTHKSGSNIDLCPKCSKPEALCPPK